MVQDLVSYRDWFNSLGKEERNAYVNSLGNSRYPEKEALLRSLSKEFLHKEVRGCGFCLLSAHFEIMKYDMAKAKELTTEYALIPGIVLHDPINKDFNKILSPRNMSEELALYHIAHNPNALTYFARVPADLDERLNKYLEEEGKAQTEGSLKILRLRMSAVSKSLDLATESYKELQKKTEALKAEVDRLTELLESMKQVESNAEGVINENPDESPETNNPTPVTGEEPAPEETSGDAGEEPAPEGTSGDAGEDKLKAEVKEFIEAGMSQDDVLAAYATEIESKQYTKTAIKAAYKAAKSEAPQGGSEE